MSLPKSGRTRNAASAASFQLEVRSRQIEPSARSLERIALRFREGTIREGKTSDRADSLFEQFHFSVRVFRALPIVPVDSLALV